MLELLYSILYVLGTYAFVIWLLYTWNQESPPETVDRVKQLKVEVKALRKSRSNLLTALNNVLAVKGLKDDRDKSNSQCVQRTHQKHRATD